MAQRLRKRRRLGRGTRLLRSTGSSRAHCRRHQSAAALAIVHCDTLPNRSAWPNCFWNHSRCVGLLSLHWLRDCGRMGRFACQGHVPGAWLTSSHLRGPHFDCDRLFGTQFSKLHNRFFDGATCLPADASFSFGRLAWIAKRQLAMGRTGWLPVCRYDILPRSVPALGTSGNDLVMVRLSLHVR